MKRASLLILLTTLASAGGLFSSGAAARDNLPQACAEAAFEKTGESRFEILDYRQRDLWNARHEITLTTTARSTNVICEFRHGRITRVDIEQDG